MRLFLDSTYFFPLIGISVESVDRDVITFLLAQKGIQLLYSSITLFELSAKGAKLVQTGILSESDVVEGILSLQHNKDTNIHHPWAGEVQRLAMYFRKDHSDYVDCLILATAVVYADKLVSEDKKIKKSVQRSWFKTISEINDHFEVLNSNQLKNYDL